ncbi:MAG: FAD-dependent oxidoreductase [Actinobacteria bacterium]|nr:FAD-dependent oxidoreductase [Actinomycetota bacterium]
MSSVRETNGSVVAADTVLVAIGCTPATEWLQQSGLRLSDGIACDDRCRAAVDVYAAGDVAEWFNTRFGREMRVEHRTNASEQGLAVAANLLGEDRAFSPVPYFWSDQYDVKLQSHGVLPAGAELTVEYGSIESGRFVVAYRRDGTVHGVLGWNAPKQTRELRELIGAPDAVAPVRAEDAHIPIHPPGDTPEP